MSQLDAKTFFVVATVALLIIRAVHGIPTAGVPVAKRYLHVMQDVPLIGSCGSRLLRSRSMKSECNSSHFRVRCRLSS